MFNFFRKKAVDFFSREEKEKITAAIQSAERSTSGEVRVYIESKCTYIDALRRAKEIFYKMNMQHTAQRNAVLVYVALKDRQLAVFGDEGIHQKVGDAFWNQAVKNIISHFNKQDYAEGIANMVISIGDALKMHFPYNAETDVNELPDDIVFGK
ncbi:MAG: TPM domain-containing protein [Bacteroidota bacterium]|nr:TPM domain-containing protein [Bacteroidota bacterium]